MLNQNRTGVTERRAVSPSQGKPSNDLMISCGPQSGRHGSLGPDAK